MDYEPFVRESISLMAHRGPDDVGVSRAPNGVFGMTRLAVIDPAQGQQPMTTPDGAVSLVFNGEIYNYRELRAQLRGRQHFRTDSDTEVLLACYLEFGLNFVRQLVGMFAFAINDRRTGQVVLGRDRFGKKPLYFATSIDGRELAFCSEIKGLRPLLKAIRRTESISTQSVYDYLSLGVVPQPQTIFNEMKSLAPGSILRFTPEYLQEEVYWNPADWFSADRLRVPVAEAVHTIRDLLDEATRIRLRSDVPLGLFLSGGVDSSVIAYEAAKRVGSPLHTFTVASGGGLDESGVAARTARYLGISNTLLPLEFDVERAVHEVVAAYDQPFSDSSAIPSMAISKAARGHVTVVLNGDGGDEVFGGYRRHVAARYSQTLEYLPRPALGALQRLLPGTSRRRGPIGLTQRLLTGAQLPPESRYLSWTTDMLRESDKRHFWRGGATLPTERLVAQTLLPSLPRLDQQMLTDVQVNLPSDLLVKMDIATMSCSLEARSPLLDHRLAEYVWTLPSQLRIKRLVPKYLLRQAYEGVLPSEVIKGKKRGFEVPMEAWLTGPLRDLVQDSLLASDARISTYLDLGEVRSLVGGESLQDRNVAFLVYGLLVLELWLRSEQSP